MNSRFQHIDIAKGTSITLVALCHSPLEIYFQQIIEAMSLFRMPLFFLLSGVFFSWHINFLTFLKRKTEALLKPYFSILLAYLLISYVTKKNDLIWQLKGMFYGNGDTIKWPWFPLWFLPHLFSVYVFSYLLFRFTRFTTLNTSVKALIITFFMIIGCSYIKSFWQINIQLFNHNTQLAGLPFSLDIILITSFYFISGQLLKDKIVNFHPNIKLLILFVFTFLFISLLTDAHVDLNKRVYTYPLFATIGAFCGIYTIIFISWFISKFEWLSYIPLRLGEASLYILIFHQPIQGKIYYFLDKYITDESWLIALAAVSFGLGLFVPLGIRWIILKSDLLSLAFLPFRSNKLLQKIFYGRGSIGLMSGMNSSRRE